jgi:hypothetical protein
MSPTDRQFGALTVWRDPSTISSYERRIMIDRATEYDRQATEYEERAKRVTDPWIREKYLTLAKHWREVRSVPKGQEARSREARRRERT